MLHKQLQRLNFPDGCVEDWMKLSLSLFAAPQ